MSPFDGELFNIAEAGCYAQHYGCNIGFAQNQLVMSIYPFDPKPQTLSRVAKPPRHGCSFSACALR